MRLVLQRLNRYRKKTLFKIRQIAFSVMEGHGLYTINCLGDSHAEIFGLIEEEGVLKRTRLNSCVVPGATAIGMANPNSKTKALTVFRNYLKKISKKEAVLLLLGEVDCGYLIWYRAQEKKYEFEEQYQLSLGNYIKLIEWVVDQGFMSIIVCEAPLPTILDGQDWGEVANMRKNVKATIHQRTALTRRYNQEIKNFCNERSIKFISYEKNILDPNKIIIMDLYKSKDPLNHHLDAEMFSVIMVDKLKKLGYK